MLLKLRRTPLRTAFTKAVNHLQEIIENDPVDKNAVETAFEMLDAKSVKLKKIDEDILELMIETNCTQEAYNIEFEAIEGYTEKMIVWQVRVKNIMKTDALGQKDNHSLVTSSSSSLRLPKIQFQQFSGELTDWLRFHNQFKKIREDESIDDGDKFQYLIQATTPKFRARDIVESFPATPENYRKAFEYLRMRFGQEDVLIQVYVRELLKLVLQNTEVNKVNLFSLYDKIEAQLRALGSLGVTKEKYAAMLFPLVESCLPAEILRAWERYVCYSSDESGKKDLDSLMKFLSIEVSSEDRIKLARNSFDSAKSNYKNKLGNLSTTATAADLFNSNFKNRKDFKFNNNNNNCIFCEKAHASENCCEAASMLYEVKKNAVIKRGVCYICLKKGHMSHSCRSDVKCIICNKRHYAVLCSKLPLRSGLETESASIENSTTASSSSSNVLANQACTSEVLLQTLVVMLQNGNHKSLGERNRNLSDVSSWEHVPSEKNFADILSCGCNAQQLVYLRWWEGTSWLSESPVQCTRSKQVPDEEAHVINSRPLTVGEVVVVKNSLKNRTLWSLARVIQLIPGKDGHVRVARVKTETGELVRPVQRLYNLELQEPEITLPKDLTDSVIRTRRGRKVISPKV
ncbi:integrase catalytic domain-containing protein [Trichonephila clavipes]|nr:integrase catalytic domain-containing protein [Trichonephila clavipes]